MADSVKFVAGGNVQAGDGIYIYRRADKKLLELCLSGKFAYILTARQIGKSSLMIQTANALKKEGICSVIIDLTQIGTQGSPEEWYFGLLTIICRQLRLLPQLMRWWQANQSLEVTQRLTQFFEEVVMFQFSDHFVIFIV